jgi:predicted dehydrogenase
MTTRVALVGYGSAGRTLHAPLLVAAGAAPAVVATASPERGAQVRADLPEADVVPDLAAALATHPGLVVLASPTGAHAEQALACVAAGVPVVVDKPLAVDAGQARRVVAAADAAGVPLTVFQNRRWDAENLTLRALLAAGDLGEVHRFERRWERWRPVPKARWRERAPAAEGGGLLLDLGPHVVDAALLLFGPVDAVYAETAAWTTEAEDDVFVSLRHSGGVRSHVTLGSVVGAPGPRTRVLGSLGAYVSTGLPGESPAFEGLADVPGHCGWLVAGESRRPVRRAPGSQEDFYPAVLAALAAGPASTPAARQAAMPVDPRDAVAVAEVIDACRLSAAAGRAVPIASAR